MSKPLETVISDWAKSEPLIMKAYIFGSRHKGNAREDSDIDVAVEIDVDGDESALSLWMDESERLSENLQRVLPCKLDLQWYGGENETPNIHEYLIEASKLAYERTV